MKYTSLMENGPVDPNCGEIGRKLFSDPALSSLLVKIPYPADGEARGGNLAESARALS